MQRRRLPPKDQTKAGIVASAIIDQAGGTTAFATLFNVRKQVVSEWRRYGFPARDFVGMSALLSGKGIGCNPIAWKQSASASGGSPTPTAEAPAGDPGPPRVPRQRATIPIPERPTFRARRDRTRRAGEPTPCEGSGNAS
jgi:hypothetical protein